MRRGAAWPGAGRKRPTGRRVREVFRTRFRVCGGGRAGRQMAPSLQRDPQGGTPCEWAWEPVVAAGWAVWAPRARALLRPGGPGHGPGQRGHRPVCARPTPTAQRQQPPHAPGTLALATGVVTSIQADTGPSYWRFSHCHNPNHTQAEPPSQPRALCARPSPRAHGEQDCRRRGDRPGPRVRPRKGHEDRRGAGLPAGA